MTFVTMAALKDNLKKFTQNKTFLLPLLLLVITLSVNFFLQPKMFDTRVLGGNLRSYMPLIFLAVAQTFVIINGSIDLAVGAEMSLVAAFLVTRLSETSTLGEFVLILLAGIGIGMLAGAFNGLAVSYIRLPAFITSYASSYIFGGIALLVLPRPGGNMPLDLADAYRHAAFLGIPFGIWVIALILIVWSVVRATRYGTFLYAVGGSEKSAYASGVPVSQNRFVTHMVAGGIAAIAAVFLALNTGSSDARIGDAMTLNSVVAVVLGGTLMSGGSGGVAGSILGVLILSFIRNIVSYTNISTWIQPLVDATIILIAIASPGFIRLFHRKEIKAK